MKTKKKLKHNYSINRVVLSETLPYEVPLTFSNRYFYRFLNTFNIQDFREYKKQQSNLILHSNPNSKKLDLIVNTLFLSHKQKTPEPRVQLHFPQPTIFQKTIQEILDFYEIFCFRISVGPVVKICIIDCEEFLNLLSKKKGLSNEESFFKKHISFLKTKNPLLEFREEKTFSIHKILIELVSNTYQIRFNLETNIINCSNDHKLYDVLLNFSLSAQREYSKELKWRNAFNYRISHKENDFRELSIPHPSSQLSVIRFFKEFKELILYYCNISRFSIRKPYSVANYIFINDKLHQAKKGQETDVIEENDSEYESIKTFFTYRKYPNIHRFYEDYRYHRAEKKYNKLFKFDIAKCFDSIYTHSIAWAIYQKEVAKEDLPSIKDSFADQFDQLMQACNFGETNGILIGPEFSRIFAEIILQSIDKAVEISLKNEDNLVFQKDYEVYRYVDDYFVFYNDEDVKEKIFTKFKICLKNYKMSISDSKSESYGKPIITALTIAKEKIGSLFDEHIKLKIEKKCQYNLDDLLLILSNKKVMPSREFFLEDFVYADVSYKTNSKNLIKKFKIILYESNVTYRDVLNFSLAAIDNRLQKEISDFDTYLSDILKYHYIFDQNPEKFKKVEKREKLQATQENSFTNHIIEILDFVFFIYAVDPRVNFTIKLCRILSRIISIFSEKIKFISPHKKSGIDFSYKHPYSSKTKFSLENQQKIFKKISDEIRLVLEKNSVKKYNQIESLYLIIALQQLGRDYMLPLTLLMKYFNIEINSEREILEFKFVPNYFVITVLLFYIRNAKQYIDIKTALQEVIISKALSNEDEIARNSEFTLLFFDILVCPYVDAKFKRRFLSSCGIATEKEQTDFLNFKNQQKYWFTKWDNFNFKKEIEAKLAHEPY